jgi:hypothetical protein
VDLPARHVGSRPANPCGSALRSEEKPRDAGRTKALGAQAPQLLSRPSLPLGLHAAAVSRADAARADSTEQCS